MSSLTLTDARRLLKDLVKPGNPAGPPPRHIALDCEELPVTLQSDDGTPCKVWLTIAVDMDTKAVISADVELQQANLNGVGQPDRGRLAENTPSCEVKQAASRGIIERHLRHLASSKIARNGSAAK
jgi:hypothetical protein